MTTIENRRGGPRTPLPSLLALTLAVSMVLTPLTARAEEPDNDYSRMSRSELEAARDELGLGGPITVLSIGGAVFLIGLPVLFTGLAATALCSGSTFDNCSNGGETTAVVGGVMMAAGAGMAIGGGLWLGDRVGERRAIKAELKKRDEPLPSANSDFSVRYGLTPTAGGGLGLAFGGTF